MALKEHENIGKGQLGEQIAGQFLIENHYTILERNYRFSHSEIDLICVKDCILIFVEVELRYSNEYGFPEESVNKKKQSSIKIAAENYIFTKDWIKDIRFDVISVELKGSQKNITHFIDAF